MNSDSQTTYMCLTCQQIFQMKDLHDDMQNVHDKSEEMMIEDHLKRTN